MNIGDFLAGVLLGTGLTLAAAWHHHGVMVDELKAGQKAELVNLHYSYQENLKRAWEYAVEECPELFERNLVLETVIIEFQQELLRFEIKCLRRIAEDRKLRE